MALRSRGWTSCVVALREDPSTADVLDVVPLGGAREPAVTVLRRLRARAREHDMVVAHGSSTLKFCAAALVDGPPFVYVNIGDLSVWSAARGRRLRRKALLSRAAGVAAISQRSHAYLVERLGVEDSSIRVLPNFRDTAVHDALVGADRGHLRRRLGWSIDTPVALYLGALSQEKRPDLAVEVATVLPEVQVALAGPGVLPIVVAANARAAGVHVMGAIADPAEALSEADTLLVTSDTEGLPGGSSRLGRPVGRP